jgi:hypothetical protein
MIDCIIVRTAIKKLYLKCLWTVKQEELSKNECLQE